MPEAPYKYWAFISYSHHDRRVARWLKAGLSKKAAPKHLKSEMDGASSRLDSIFMDESEAEPGPNLLEKLHEALRQSRNLIVICSPFSTASAAVQEEIRYFKSLGRAKNIICVIASGTPGATQQGTPHLEAFPEPLRVDEHGQAIPDLEWPWALNVGDETKAEQKKVIDFTQSRIHEASPDSWKKRRQSRTRTRILAWGAGTAVACAGLATYWAAFHHPWTSYARDFVRVHGIWQPLLPVSKTDAQKRLSSYKFERRGFLNPPDRVELINARGKCAIEGMSSILGQSPNGRCGSIARACSASFEYDQNGDITRETLLDQYGQPLETVEYTLSELGLFTDAGVDCARSSSGINYVRFTRSSEPSLEGMNERVEFLRQVDGRLEARPNSVGEYGIAWRRRPDGLVLERWSIGENGERILNTKGYSGFLDNWSSDLRVRTRQYLLPNSEPALPTTGVSKSVRAYNEAGAMIREAFFDAAGAPTLNEKGFASVDYAGTIWGEVEKGAYFGKDGAPVFSKYGSYSYKQIFDENGYLISSQGFDQNGQPVVRPDNGAHRIEHVPNEYGNDTRFSYFDDQNNPVISSNPSYKGAHSVDLTIDERGNVPEVRYLNAEGAPAWSGDSARYGFIREFGPRSEILVRHSLDETHQPDRSVGVYVRQESEYDEAGNPLRRFAFDGAGNPARQPGWDYTFGRQNEYDEEGLIVALTHLDSDGTPMAGRSGYATIRWENGPFGKVRKESYFDVEGEPILYNGAHYLLLDYDFAGRRTSLSYYGLDGEPALRSGVHRYAYIYDERGNELERSWYGTDGNLTEGANGNSIMRRTFDDRGNRISIHFFDANGERMAVDWGPSGYLSKYDQYDREIHRQYIGVSDEAISLPENQGGYSAISYEYDAVGNIVAETYRDEADIPIAFAGRGYSTQNRTYDEYRNVTSYQYFDAAGAFTEDDWMAKISIEYDNQGHMTNRRFYNSRDELMLAPGSQRAGEDISYDDYGRVILNRSIGLEGEPVERADLGWSEMRTAYDEWNNATQTCFKLSGEQIDCN